MIVSDRCDLPYITGIHVGDEWSMFFTIRINWINTEEICSIPPLCLLYGNIKWSALSPPPTPIGREVYFLPLLYTKHPAVVHCIMPNSYHCAMPMHYRTHVVLSYSNCTKDNHVKNIDKWLHYKVWDEITNPFSNSHAATVEVLNG